MPHLIRVAIVMGGRSGEHDVSLNSGREVLANIDRKKYSPRTVVIGKDGLWSLDGGAPASMLDVLKDLEGKIDAAFLALHGPNGEDGTMQGLFHLLGIPYTGSDYYASSLAMNKPRAKDVYRAAGLDVADDIVIRRDELPVEPHGVAALASTLASRFGLPLVVKTTKLGSSVGVDIVKDVSALAERLTEFLALGDEVLVERFVRGTEVTSPVLDDPETGNPVALPLIEIRPNLAGWFDYRSKYEKKGADEICPAPVDEETTRRCQAVGLAAHRSLGCRGMSRTDMIVEPAEGTSGRIVEGTGGRIGEGTSGRIVVIETNTIPGFTQTSLLPQAAAEAGISYSRLVDMLIQETLSRSSRR